jgi:hypothetical protein
VYKPIFTTLTAVWFCALSQTSARAFPVRLPSPQAVKLPRNSSFLISRSLFRSPPFRYGVRAVMAS